MIFNFGVEISGQIDLEDIQDIDADTSIAFSCSCIATDSCDFFIVEFKFK